MSRVRSRGVRAGVVSVLALAVALAAPLEPRADPGAPFDAPRRPALGERPPPPRDLVLLFNAAGLLGNPFDGNRGWRLEAGVERRRKGRLSSAVVIGGGSVAVEGYPEEWLLGISGQARWYALGDFERGLFVGGVLDFRRIGPYLMTGVGPLLGYRFTTGNGVAAEVHFGMPLLSDSFSTSDTAGRVPFRDAMRATLPGVFVGIGAALRTGQRIR